jgi:hypothetical protein
MEVDSGIELVGQRSHTVQQLRGRERQPLEPDTDGDPAVAGPVDRPVGGGVVGEPIEAVLVPRGAGAGGADSTWRNMSLNAVTPARTESAYVLSAAR